MSPKELTGCALVFAAVIIAQINIDFKINSEVPKKSIAKKSIVIENEKLK